MTQERNFKRTPMYEQYLSIKEQYPDALLFYRMGDFYELFFEDAEVVARELQLTLTSRNKNNDVPMCGVPWHALEPNLSQLVQKGYKIAVCDQVEDPRTAKGLVKRGVTRVVTSGTVLEDINLEAKAHNFLGAFIWNEENSVGAFAWADASTGYWSGVQAGKEAELWQWVLKMSPRELLIPESADVPSAFKAQDGIQLVRVPFRSYFEPKTALDRVLTAQKAADPAALGLDKRPYLTQACGALLAYLSHTQQSAPVQLAPFQPTDVGQYLIIDEVTERNLELFRRLDGKKGKGTLWQVLDETITPMGGRLLAERLSYPWRSLVPIVSTQEVVAFLRQREPLLEALRASLTRVYDLERLSTRISLNRCQPRDFGALKESLLHLPHVRAALPAEDGEDAVPPALQRLLRGWDDLEDLATLLEQALRDSLPAQVTDGGLFKAGFNPELDELLDLAEHGEARLQELLQREQTENGLPKLKLGFNRVFGYYFELTKSQLGGSLPEHFQRRQTMTNAERFTTPELKELEERLLHATEAQKTLEYKLFQELRLVLDEARPRLLLMADLLAHVDFWQSLAWTALQRNWVRPEMHEGCELLVSQGRHPVVEEVEGAINFIPNDLRMDEEHRLLLITGPNMAGKSTILRQTALFSILAQMGSCVPAAKARLGLVDRVFSRVGASDNLAHGHSTFMVEMMETSRILRQSTKRSLIILDEIGRGTSTYDGMALAWAVVEDLATRAGGHIRTLFATHYHELTSLEGRIPGLFNMNVSVMEQGGEIIFSRRLIPGPADKSYGIEVARLAGVPPSVVQRAREILDKFDKNSTRNSVLRATSLLLPGLDPPPAKSPAVKNAHPSEPPVHPVAKELARLNPDELSPMQAWTLLTEWKRKWSAKK